MKKILLAAALLLPLAVSAKDPVLQITPEPLPTGVSVTPAQGFVDVSLSDQGNPKGVGAIAIVFNYQEVTINEKCKTPAKLYKNDFTTPVEESFFRGIDIESHMIASVLFKKGAYNNTGIYKVEIPEGFFVYADGVDSNGDLTGTNPTPALTLYYEIYVGYAISPTPGVVPEIQEIVLTFPDADEIVMNESGQIAFFQDNGPDYLVVTNIMDYNNDGKKNEVVLSLSDTDGIAIEALIEPGTYSLQIPAGKFTYKTYGPDYASDPTDFVERTSPYLFFKYDIPFFAQPEIIPATDEPVESFSLFDIILPDSFQKWTNNDKVNNNIYTVSDNGVVNDGAPVMIAKINPELFYDPATTDYDYPASEVILSLYDADENKFIDEWTPAPGNYCLRLGKSLCFGQYTDSMGNVSFVDTPQFDYYYTVQNSGSETGVEDIENAEIADETVTIYTLSGIRVALNAAPEVLGELAPGIYIVNGKKMLKH